MLAREVDRFVMLDLEVIIVDAIDRKGKLRGTRFVAFFIPKESWLLRLFLLCFDLLEED